MNNNPYKGPNIRKFLKDHELINGANVILKDSVLQYGGESFKKKQNVISKTANAIVDVFVCDTAGCNLRIKHIVGKIDSRFECIPRGFYRQKRDHVHRSSMYNGKRKDRRISIFPSISRIHGLFPDRIKVNTGGRETRIFISLSQSDIFRQFVKPEFKSSILVRFGSVLSKGSVVVFENDFDNFDRIKKNLTNLGTEIEEERYNENLQKQNWEGSQLQILCFIPPRGIPGVVDVEVTLFDNRIPLKNGFTYEDDENEVKKQATCEDMFDPISGDYDFSISKFASEESEDNYDDDFFDMLGDVNDNINHFKTPKIFHSIYENDIDKIRGYLMENGSECAYEADIFGLTSFDVAEHFQRTRILYFLHNTIRSKSEEIYDCSSKISEMRENMKLGQVYRDIFNGNVCRVDSDENSYFLVDDDEDIMVKKMNTSDLKIKLERSKIHEDDEMFMDTEIHLSIVDCLSQALLISKIDVFENNRMKKNKDFLSVQVNSFSPVKLIELINNEELVNQLVFVGDQVYRIIKTSFMKPIFSDKMKRNEKYHSEEKKIFMYSRNFQIRDPEEARGLKKEIDDFLENENFEEIDLDSESALELEDIYYLPGFDEGIEEETMFDEDFPTLEEKQEMNRMRIPNKDRERKVMKNIKILEMKGGNQICVMENESLEKHVLEIREEHLWMVDLYFLSSKKVDVQVILEEKKIGKVVEITCY